MLDGGFEGLLPIGVACHRAAGEFDSDLGHGVLQAAFRMDEDAIGVTELAGAGAGMDCGTGGCAVLEREGEGFGELGADTLGIGAWIAGPGGEGFAECEHEADLQGGAGVHRGAAAEAVQAEDGGVGFVHDGDDRVGVGLENGGAGEIDTEGHAAVGQAGRTFQKVGKPRRTPWRPR